MKTHHAEAKNRKNGKPLEVVKVGSVSVPIYRHTNIVPQRDFAGKIIYGPAPDEGKPQALVKYQSDIFTIAYYEDHPGLHHFETSTRRRGADLKQDRRRDLKLKRFEQFDRISHDAGQTMPNPATSSGIRDNHRRGVVADFLKAKIQTGSRLSVVSAYFTIYAYEARKDRLDQIEHLDFLFGEPRFIASLDPDKTEKKAFILDGNGLHLANKLQQKRVARECADWIRQKVDIRSVRHSQILPVGNN